MDSVMPFVIGGSSGMIATCVIQPVDLIKVSIQLNSEAKKGGKYGFFDAVRDIRSEGGGLRSFYRGIDSALARQLFYTTTRLGIFKNLTEWVKERNKGQAMTFFQRAYCGAFAGFVGSIVGNPADLALVRMQADSKLPPEQRRNYRNVFHAFNKIVQDEGVLALWRGCVPTVVRAVVLNLVMLASYEQAKDEICKYFNTTETQGVRLAGSGLSGLFSSFASLPFDNAKTKMQKMVKNPDGSYPYKNIFDAMGKTVANEGVRGLWAGFLTFYVRIAPHVMITLVIQDFLTDRWKKYKSQGQPPKAA
jgi:solute carrier family 25 oxoglutarate transporter 11